MRVRVWNAFASNNSGSYTIVGSFDSEEIAREVADELRVAVDAETAGDDAVLRAHLAKFGVALAPVEDWPDPAWQPAPVVWATGYQVFVHAGYVVSMPRELGALIYARGGRVKTELNHAHEAIVCELRIYFPYQIRRDIDAVERVQQIVDALFGDGGALAKLPAGDRLRHPPDLAWRGITRADPERLGDYDLVIGAIFVDLPAGFAAVEAAAHAVEAKVTVKVSEARGHGEDPLAHLRARTPRPASSPPSEPT